MDYPNSVCAAKVLAGGKQGLHGNGQRGGTGALCSIGENSTVKRYLDFNQAIFVDKGIDVF